MSEKCTNAVEAACGAVGHHDGRYVTALYEALAHACEAYVRADLGNQPHTVVVCAGLVSALERMDRLDAASAVIKAELGARESGGRGTELWERITQTLQIADSVGVRIFGSPTSPKPRGN